MIQGETEKRTNQHRDIWQTGFEIELESNWRKKKRIGMILVIFAWVRSKGVLHPPRHQRDNARVDFGRICQWGENRRGVEIGIGRQEEEKRRREKEVVKRL